MDEKYTELSGRATGAGSTSVLEAAEFAVLDLETTGLDLKKDEIISIAIIPMTGFQVHFGKRFYSLVKPKRFHERSIKIHGICLGDLEKAPTFEETCEKIFDMIHNRIVVGFNVIFDINFIKEGFKKIVKNQVNKNKYKKLDLRYVDIKEIEVWISRRTGAPTPCSLDLSDLIHKYQIEEVARHNALSDAYITARIFQNQLKVLSDFNITPNDLIQITRTSLIF
ncbi:MAG: 3'-5' exonuclease [Candidatus Methanomethyliales bacterium]|nr:3'-5' exonuclease [Candidatus Methanomethylicales archaeon]